MSEQDHALYPWQSVAWASLRRRMNGGRLPHALLLIGAEGLGKRELARRVGRMLLCTSPTADGLPCGNCQGCQLTAAGSHPDYHVLEPEEGSRVIKVDAVRELSRVLGMKSQLGGERVGIIAPAESMNTNAANSLLKTLEEPPEHTTLILVAHRPAQLPATIRSRCQVITIAAPSHAVASEWLARNGRGEAVRLLGVVGNAPLAAQALHEQGGAEVLQTLLEQMCGIAEGRLSPVEVASRWGKDDVDRVTQLLLAVIMDLVRVQSTGVEARISRLNQLPASLDSHELHGYLDEVMEQRGLTDHPLNHQLVLERLFIRWGQVCAKENAHG
ncbi:DNA polymerase III subunit delta' [Aquisalimonas asiatica]|uniref:DNA polymerase III subunit delta' n=1 Tax=Aquisalimonas asiatica TaxID=406100 RepID=A0A1H8QDS9_9GAMM|nr:DNA polymerase III subunit delta' [Aquisalimonas asiatica]SEO52399.1 DNA polymerase-3 subunit delta' [Aquisalimonas asiatica]